MQKYNHLIIVICVLLFSISCQNELQKKHESQLVKKRVIGYVAGWTGFDVSKVNPNKLTHINYAFANIVNGEVRFEKDYDVDNIEKLLALKKQNPDLKILYSIGGWVWSDQFSNAAMNDKNRKLFAQSAIKIMLQNKLDGIDLDWEYPGQRAEDNIYRPSDKENFTRLLKEIREQLNKLDTDYLLTIASGADQAYIDHTNLGEAVQYLDFVNIMTYDFYHGWHYQSGHHANFQKSDSEKFGGNSVVEAVDRHIKAGVPKDKLVIGIPFYGRQWLGVQPENKGLYQNAQTAGLIIGYNQIQDSLEQNTFKNFWDASAQAPYAWNEEGNSFISYENIKSLELKIDFVKAEKLGGIMFWEYSLDNGELLETVYTKYLN